MVKKCILNFAIGAPGSHGRDGVCFGSADGIPEDEPFQGVLHLSLCIGYVKPLLLSRSGNTLHILMRLLTSGTDMELISPPANPRLLSADILSLSFVVICGMSTEEIARHKTELEVRMRQLLEENPDCDWLKKVLNNDQQGSADDEPSAANELDEFLSALEE